MNLAWMFGGCSRCYPECHDRGDGDNITRQVDPCRCRPGVIQGWHLCGNSAARLSGNSTETGAFEKNRWGYPAILKANPFNIQLNFNYFTIQKHCVDKKYFKLVVLEMSTFVHLGDNILDVREPWTRFYDSCRNRGVFDYLSTVLFLPHAKFMAF